MIRKIVDILLDTFGYVSIKDLLDHTIPSVGKWWVVLISLIATTISQLLGFPVEIFFGLTGGLTLELISGVYLNVFVRNNGWSSKKFGRFFFKVFILFSLITLINQLKVGFSKWNASWVVQSIIDFSFDSLFVVFMITMTWYIILSSVENFAASGLGFFITLAKWMRIRKLDFEKRLQ